MNFYCRYLLLGLSCSIFVVSCSSSSSGVSPSMSDYDAKPAASTSVIKTEKKILAQVNTVRKKASLPEVKYHAGVSGIARAHSQYMAKHGGSFSGESKDITHEGFHLRLGKARADHKIARMGENVAYMVKTSSLAPDTIKEWLNSKLHKKTMLDRRYDVAGVGVAYKGSVTLVTLLMAKERTADTAYTTISHRTPFRL
ncbi:CAP domain-containing protein [Akkermansiaceae bacterium]|nr:CAP domain-containing protein [Akkermansiaceae bacterium]